MNASPLFVKRRLLNTANIINWAKSQGLTRLLKPVDLHVTIVFSKQPIVWSKQMAIRKCLRIRGGRRSIETFGDATVLCFTSHRLCHRWAEFRHAGASWNFDRYRSHVTLTYHSVPSHIKPYLGELDFGSEQFAPIEDDWREQITELEL